MTCVSWFLSRVSVDYSSFLSVWSTYLHIIRLWFLSIAFRYTNSFGRTLVFTVLKWYPDFHEFHSHTFINTRRKTYLHPVILIWDSLCGFLSKSFRCTNSFGRTLVFTSLKWYPDFPDLTLTHFYLHKKKLIIIR